MQSKLPISIVIPTYGREQVLLDTIGYLTALAVRAQEIIVVDQTVTHEPATSEALLRLESAGDIRLLRRQEPSIPAAMNAGLLASRCPTVLFLDDDIRPEPDLVAEHARAAGMQGPDVLHAGRVLQPWEEGVDIPVGGPFRFAGTRASWLSEFMGGNFSVNRERAIAAGGFDEQFVRVAYRFEAEFAARWLATGGRIWFCPSATIHHLKAVGGGTRVFGDHLTTVKPSHAVGAYYYALRTGDRRTLLGRPLRSVGTRFHLKAPWHIPGTLVAELRGLLWALRLHRQGPKLIGRAG